MKKYIAIPLLMIYMLGATGIMIHLHYCGKNLESWNVYKTSGGCTDDTCDDEMEDGCCRDKVVTVKISEDQNSVDFFKLKLPEQISLTLPDFSWSPADSKTVVVNKNKVLPFSNAPPGRWQNIPLHKLHLRFTYYG